MRNGRLIVTLPDGTTTLSGQSQPVADLQVRDWKVFDAVLASGDIGFAESYMRREWDTTDLVRLLTMLAWNRDALQRAIFGNAWALLAHRMRHILNANTRTGSRRNIAAHYDLGNDFYALWLDPSMTYSSALFEGDATRSLEDAQRAKYRRILHALAPRPGDRVLEIGCGWGGFAEVAATEYDCRVLGVTLSTAQLDYARRRAERGGYADRVSFDLCDYRDLRGSYEHIVSIEMCEAVGRRYWPTYFRRLAQLLKPGARAVVQSITIADGLFSRYARGTDFIQRYIFPGGMLPSVAALREQARRAHLRVERSFAFGTDYARTLRLWHERFNANSEDIQALGFDERFLRMWRFYLSYCEAGFSTGSTDIYQFELTSLRS
jgi:cyclopropane-fatty-acyl-phospholipid synthase